VQRKNRWDHYYKSYELEPEEGVIPIVTEQPLRRMRQPVREEELRRFLTLIPDWSRYSEGLRCLVLEDGGDGSFGWCSEGVIALAAWDGYDEEWDNEFYEEHEGVLDKLGVDGDWLDDGYVRCTFTREQARGFQLMHVFLHELGHHYDRMQTRRQQHVARGEDYAEQFALDLAERMWPQYWRAFGG